MSEETQPTTEETPAHQKNGLATVADLFDGQPAVRRHRTATLPVSGHKVRIQSLTESEMGTYQDKSTRSKRGQLELIPQMMKNASRRFIALCLVDGHGNRLLGDKHVGGMAGWDAADVNYLYAACAEHCGVNREDIEQLVKNSADARVGSTGSA